MLTAFITILFRTSFSKFRSSRNDRNESQEEPIIPRAPIEIYKTDFAIGRGQVFD